jgi:hypothetical protein
MNSQFPIQTGREKKLMPGDVSATSQSCPRGVGGGGTKKSIRNAARARAAALIRAVALVATVTTGVARGACVPVNTQGQPVKSNRDAVAMVLAASAACPVNVFDFRARILDAGGRIETALVNNQGFHHPNVGSFSLFEIVSGRLKDPIGVTVERGDFFFGHFTASRNGTLIANQAPRNLMVELIAFDPAKGVFNFYELVGDGERSRWFYRGDSLDISADLSLLHRQKDPNNPQFGNRLRCSGCHMNGGPVMKELTAPHNDWFTTSRPLTFGQLTPDATLKKLLTTRVDGARLAEAVSAGARKLHGSSEYQKFRSTLSLQEQLRCLFCPAELNLESDTHPFDDQKKFVSIASAFLVDPRLAQASITIPRSHYEAALKKAKSQFPRTNRIDADHAWLAPVKAATDILAIRTLVERKVIDEEFVADVLAVDFTNPVISKERCSLLSAVPAAAGADWQKKFRATLQLRTDPAAKELLQNLTDSDRTAQFHRAKAALFLKHCQSNLQSSEAVSGMVRVLGQARVAVFESEISSHGPHQILEPGGSPGQLTDDGFRLVFPVFPGIQPFKRRPEFRVNEACEVTQTP